MYDVSKCAPQEALRNLDAAFENFFEGRARFPKLKSRKHGLGAFTVTGTITVRPGCIQLPRLGWVRLKENGYLPSKVHINSATVSERARRWFVSVSVVVQQEKPRSVCGPVVGVDRGLRSLAVVSDGFVVENPRALHRQERKLKRLQRAVNRKVKGSSNRHNAVRALARLHLKISNVREDALHKATTKLARTKSVIVVEDLGVRGMMANRRLAKSIADAGWGEFARQLVYKTAWYGSRLVVADRFFPSTKMCCQCGNIKETIGPSERTYSCERCETVMDRDLNAAINLSRWPGVARTPKTPVESGVPLTVASEQPLREAGTTSLLREA
jgi:putative transposase